MKIVQVLPGTGGAFYCQNCVRDNELFRGLRRAGQEVILAPMYLPFAFDDPSMFHDVPLFFGAVNVYLQEKSALFRHTPRWLDRFLDGRRLLKWAASKAGSTSASGLEDMTLSMLRGEEGRQAKELRRLLRWMTEVRPDVVHLSNSLLLGLAGPVKRELGCAVVCSLQDEDSWLDQMDPSRKDEIWDTIREKAREVDAFTAVSEYFRSRMEKAIHLPPERLHVVPPGLEYTEYEPAAHEGPPVLGFLSRLSPDLGLDIVVDAFLLLKADEDFSDLRLKVTGGTLATDQAFLEATLAKVEEQGQIDFFELVEPYDRASRISFLQSLRALSVPIPEGSGSGTFLLESLACGVPAVQPRVGAFAEILESTGGGVLFDPNTPEVLADALRPLLLDPGEARTLGRQGREGVLDKYTVGRMADDMVNVYTAAKMASEGEEHTHD